MFSQQEILHFQTFGYVVARKLLSDAEVASTGLPCWAAPCIPLETMPGDGAFQ